MGTFTIVEAVDGQQALKRIESSRFDLVICDWDMPNNGTYYLIIIRIMPEALLNNLLHLRAFTGGVA